MSDIVDDLMKKEDFVYSFEEWEREANIPEILKPFLPAGLKEALKNKFKNGEKVYKLDIFLNTSRMLPGLLMDWYSKDFIPRIVAINEQIKNLNKK